MVDGTELQAPNETRFSRIVHVASTGSTNADLLAAVREGKTLPTVLVTDHQDQGRGRQQRRWVDVPGKSLLVSYVIECSPLSAPLVPLVAGLSVLGAMADVGVPTDAIGLKWPNDVLVCAEPQPKLAGILVESISVGSSLHAVVGVGVNLYAVSDEPRSVGLNDVVGAEGAQVIDRFDLLRSYLLHTEGQLTRLELGRHEAILDDYRSVCLTLGRSVQFQLLGGSPGEIVTGLATGIDGGGGLLVEDPAGTIKLLTAGEAHHV